MRYPIQQSIRIASYLAKQKRSKRERYPLVTMLEPLHTCNLTCTGCGRIREYSTHLSQRLTLEQCLKAVRESDTPIVSVCGGEPLIYPEIDELIAALLDDKRVVYLCTNAMFVPKHIDRWKPSPYFNVNVHLDGMEKTHDLVVEKQGVFQEAVAAIKLLKSRGFTVCTNTTVYAETDPAEIEELFTFLTALGVDGLLISPGFDYVAVADKRFFLTRDMIKEKFRAIHAFASKFRLWSTPKYLAFLAGERDYDCTPWANVTYNIKGWKGPCYLITDGHYITFDELMESTNWDYYEKRIDPRCENCMVHCGYEASAQRETTKSIKDSLQMLWWTLT
ncbi:MAG: adenosyl-hopene transferase HpnH [Deltaproteobacteria bacterium]|nr:adenosyl-hopene transferase HpnH [Deltaproteobacteria bacterium]